MIFTHLKRPQYKFHCRRGYFSDFGTISSERTIKMGRWFGQAKEKKTDFEHPLQSQKGTRETQKHTQSTRQRNPIYSIALRVFCALAVSLWIIYECAREWVLIWRPSSVSRSKDTRRMKCAAEKQILSSHLRCVCCQCRAACLGQSPGTSDTHNKFKDNFNAAKSQIIYWENTQPYRLHIFHAHEHSDDGAGLDVHYTSVSRQVRLPSVLLGARSSCDYSTFTGIPFCHNNERQSVSQPAYRERTECGSLCVCGIIELKTWFFDEMEPKSGVIWTKWNEQYGNIE